MIELPICILFYEGPHARFFLETFKALGYKPKKIIYLIFDKKTKEGTEISFLRRFYTRKQFIFNNYYPLLFLKKQPVLCDKAFKELESHFAFDDGFIKGTFAFKTMESFSDSVRYLKVSSFKNKNLGQIIRRLNNNLSYYIYTGGGILPKSFLSSIGKDIIHIHPGFLPFTRGNDGVLWSISERSKLGVSSFIMNEGIDTGLMIDREELLFPKFNTKFKNLYKDELYNFLFSFYDPLLRAYHLRNLILGNPEFNDFFLTKQNSEDSNTYKLMDPDKRDATLKLIFNIV